MQSKLVKKPVNEQIGCKFKLLDSSYFNILDKIAKDLQIYIYLTYLACLACINILTYT